MIDHLSEPASFIGISAAARALDEEVSQAARSDAKVLITGESGAGKEVAARLIHTRSTRAAGPWVAINCAGVPDTLLESELFGHVKGSFTGAYRDKPGLIESAHRGTIFLDEVGEMSMRMQAALLRFLESGEIQRVGADRPSERVDVRVICATNRTLPDRIARGEFREDLYYRLNVIRLHVPPLRERREDLPLLVDFFVARHASEHRIEVPGLAPNVRERLLAYHWPGNIRELKNVIERIVVRAGQGEITLEDLPVDLRLATPLLMTSEAPTGAQLAEHLAHELFDRIVLHRESFWTAVYAPFMDRDVTRDTVRRVVRRGLDQSGGRYEDLFTLFHLTREEGRRLVVFLRKHGCLVSVPVGGPRTRGSSAEQVA
ncbi:MAG: sigma-54 dependent transcriptional regulator [Vicinamibacteraceae bacterium]|nr:sigma-54 dependent transcriptional regulator [Vicinamibacteraceae bacterium]